MKQEAFYKLKYSIKPKEIFSWLSAFGLYFIYGVICKYLIKDVLIKRK